MSNIANYGTQDHASFPINFNWCDVIQQIKNMGLE